MRGGHGVRPVEATATFYNWKARYAGLDGAEPFEGSVDDAGGNTPTTLVGSGHDSTHPHVAGSHAEQSEVSGDPAVVLEPQVFGVGAEIEPVDLVIGAVLLDDEDVDPQAEQGVELRGGQLRSPTDERLESGVGHHRTLLPGRPRTVARGGGWRVVSHEVAEWSARLEVGPTVGPADGLFELQGEAEQ